MSADTTPEPIRSVDGYTAAELISRTIVLPFGTRHNRSHIREIAEHIDNEIRPVHYREAAASLDHIHPEAARLLRSVAKDLEEGEPE